MIKPRFKRGDVIETKTIRQSLFSIFMIVDVAPSYYFVRFSDGHHFHWAIRLVDQAQFNLAQDQEIMKLLYF